LAAAGHAAELNQLLAESAIALGAMAVVSAVLGWLVAGRVLRPLRAMTAAARAISAAARAISAELTVLAGKLREGLDQADRLVENLLLLARAQHGARDDQESIPLGPLLGAAPDPSGMAVRRPVLHACAALLALASHTYGPSSLCQQHQRSIVVRLGVIAAAAAGKRPPRAKNNQLPDTR